MTFIISTKATEGSTFFVDVSFTDENGTAFTPDTLFWSLTDAFGNIVNDREDVEITTPAATERIMLSGDDLVVDEPFDSAKRYIIVHGTYTSGEVEELPFRDWALFDIDKKPG